MKKTNATMLTAAAFAAAMALAPGAGNSSAQAASVVPSDSSFDPAAVEMAALYGPPPSYWSTADEPEITTTQTTAADVPEFFRTTDDFMQYQLMYGPPAFFTVPTIPDQPQTTTDDFLHYQLMYGPPSFFTDTVIPDQPQTTTEMTYQTMYGPPPISHITLPTTVAPDTTEPETTLRTIPADPGPGGMQQAMYGPPPCYGDFTYDQKVNAFDLVAAKQLLTSDETPNWWFINYNMDVNRDGQFSLADVLLLNRYLLGEDVKLGAVPEDEPIVPISTEEPEDPVTETTTKLQNVYGPPPGYYTSTQAVPEPIQEVETEMQDVYGPPPSYYKNN